MLAEASMNRKCPTGSGEPGNDAFWQAILNVIRVSLPDYLGVCVHEPLSWGVGGPFFEKVPIRLSIIISSLHKNSGFHRYSLFG